MASPAVVGLTVSNNAAWRRALTSVDGMLSIRTIDENGLGPLAYGSRNTWREYACSSYLWYPMVGMVKMTRSLAILTVMKPCLSGCEKSVTRYI